MMKEHNTLINIVRTSFYLNLLFKITIATFAAPLLVLTTIFRLLFPIILFTFVGTNRYKYE